jgi:Sodium/hydrogen exchanger family
MTSRVARYLGAAGLLGVGVDHIQQYFGADYRVVPTIGTLFALNFAVSALFAVGLFVPIERIFRRGGRVLLSGFALSGIGVALGSLIGLLVSEQTPLFGFMESGYRQAILIAIVLETVTTALLAAFLVSNHAAGASRAQRAREDSNL